MRQPHETRPGSEATTASLTTPFSFSNTSPQGQFAENGSICLSDASSRGSTPPPRRERTSSPSSENGHVSSGGSSPKSHKSRRNYASLGGDTSGVGGDRTVERGRERRARQPQVHRKPNRLLKLLIVSDSATGVSLFQHKWRWNDTKEQGSLGKLLHSFHQFARHLQGADNSAISCVNFEQQPESGHSRRPSSGTIDIHGLGVGVGGVPYAGGVGAGGVNVGAAYGGGGGAGFKRQSSRSTAAMQALCAQDDTVTIALFYDIPHSTVTHSTNQDVMRSFLELCRSEFVRLHRKEVEAMRPRLKILADGGGSRAQENELHALQASFDGFSERLETLLVSCCPATGADEDLAVGAVDRIG